MIRNNAFSETLTEKVRKYFIVLSKSSSNKAKSFAAIFGVLLIKQNEEAVPVVGAFCFWAADKSITQQLDKRQQ